MRHYGIVILLALSFVFGNDYFQQDVAYEIHVTLDDSAHTLSANESIIYTNNSADDLDFIWFHLWPNAYKNNTSALEKQFLVRRSSRMAFAKEKERGFIDSLNFTSNGVELSWSYHPEWIDVAKVELSEALKPGESVTIETPFFVKLPKVFSRLGHSDQHYEITQWYPKPAVYDKDGWHAMPYLDMGEFYSEFGTFDVYITLPADYRIMATGDLVDGESEYSWLDSLAKEGDAIYELDKKDRKKKYKELNKAKHDDENLKTVHFHQENVHDFAWFADWKWIVRKGELVLGDSTNSIILWSMYLPKNGELWEKSLEYIHDAGYWYSKFFGDYPYKHISAVDGDMSAGGGMEYPNITVISSGGSKDLLEFVIMHEVGHNWFYGILGSNERSAPWLDEGINEYANILYWEKKYDDRGTNFIIQDVIQNKIGIAKNLQMRWIMGYMGYIMQANPGNDQEINLHSEDYASSNYGSIVYGKTAIMFRFLKHYLGEQLMEETMQDYYQSWKFKHPDQEDIEEVFDRHISENIDWFWVNGIGSTNVIDYGFREEGESLYLESKGTMVVPVEVAFYDNSGEEIDRRWIPIKNQSMPLPLPPETRRTIIDPDDYMPDIYRSNNTTSKPLAIDFVFDQPDYKKRNLYWVPWVTSWNQYNGWTPGLMLYSGYIPGYRYGFGIKPMWDFNNSKLIGGLTAQRTFYQLFGFQKITVKGSYDDYSSAAGWKLETTIEKSPSIHSRAKWTYKAIINNKSLNTEGLDNLIYDAGTYTTGKVNAVFSNKPSTWLSYATTANIQVALQGASFAKWNLINNLKYRWSKKEYSQLRLWIGGFLSADDVPKHYETFLAGGVDPDFSNGFVFNRTSEQTVYNLYDEQFLQEGPGLKGRYDGPSSQEFAWGVNLTQDIPFNVKIFGDIAGDENDKYIDAGIVFGSESFGIYLPIYQSWEVKDKTVTGSDWLIERARFTIDISSIINL